MSHEQTTPAIDLSETAVAKAGNVFAVTFHDGRLPADADHPLGVFLDDARHLRAHELTLAGERPQRLGPADELGDTLVHELTNPPLTLPGGRALPRQTVRVRLHRRLDPGGVLTESIRFESYAAEPVALGVTVRLDADFAPVLAIRGHAALPDPDATTTTAAAEGLTFHARGRDGVTRATTITADPAPDHVDPATRTLAFDVHLSPTAPVDLVLRHAFTTTGAPAAAPPPQPPPAFTTLDVDDGLVQRVADRALRDLRTLVSERDGRRFFAAGVPWYATLFGRDSLIAAHQALAWAPEVAADTLRLLAAHLGAATDDAHEEDPGKVVHELRAGEAAGADLTPFARYYGSVDATPLFLCVLADLVDWTGDLGLVADLRPQLDAMVAWLDGPGDRDGDGLLDYAPRAARGLRNHGWKDSPDGICFADGTPLGAPVAVVEAQGYAIAGRRGLARHLRALGDHAAADRLDARAGEHARRLHEAFWLPEQGFYAMALDRHHTPTTVLASNQGHLLWARVHDDSDRRAAAVRDALTGPDAFTGWGIRTLGARHAAFNPVAYHRGSVWPHDTAMIAEGLRHHGFDAAFAPLLEGVLAAAAASPAERLPELFAGYDRDGSTRPVPYPVACRPQAWAAGAVPALVTAALGLRPDAANHRLTLRRPLLPAAVSRARLTGLRVGDAAADLELHRSPGGAIELARLTTTGRLEVEIER